MGNIFLLLLAGLSHFICYCENVENTNKTQLMCGNTVDLGSSFDRKHLEFMLVKQSLEWIKKPCLIHFTGSEKSHDGILLTFLSHSIPSLLPRCNTYALILHLHRLIRTNNTTPINGTVGSPEESQENATSQSDYSSIKLCSINWGASTASYLFGSNFSMEIKHPLVSNSHLDFTPVVAGDVIDHPMPNPTIIDDEERLKFNPISQSSDSTLQMTNLMNRERVASRVSNSFESIAPDTDFQFSIMITPLNRSTMQSLAKAPTTGSYVRNGNSYQNLTTYFAATKNWPLTSSKVDDDLKTFDASQLFTLENKYSQVHSGWVFFLMLGSVTGDDSYKMNNCSEDVQVYVSFTAFDQREVPVTYCGFDSNGTRVVEGRNVTVHMKYSQIQGNGEFPSGFIIGYVPFSEHRDPLIIPNWAVLLIVSSAIFIFFSMITVSLHQKSKTVVLNERKPLLSDYQFT